LGRRNQRCGGRKLGAYPEKKEGKVRRICMSFDELGGKFVLSRGEKVM